MLKLLKELGDGCIVNVFFVVVLIGGSFGLYYLVLKVGLIGLIKLVVKEFGKYGILVNVVVFGFIRFEMIDIFNGDILNGILKVIFFGRFVELGEVVEVIC